MRSLIYLCSFGEMEERKNTRGGHNIDLRCGPERVQDMRHNPQSALWELMLKGTGRLLPRVPNHEKGQRDRLGI